MGGRNPFLGIAYIVVGGLCIILGAVFTITQFIKPRQVFIHSPTVMIVVTNDIQETRRPYLSFMAIRAAELGYDYRSCTKK